MTQEKSIEYKVGGRKFSFQKTKNKIEMRTMSFEAIVMNLPRLVIEFFSDWREKMFHVFRGYRPKDSAIGCPNPF